MGSARDGDLAGVITWHPRCAVVGRMWSPPTRRYRRTVSQFPSPQRPSVASTVVRAGLSAIPFVGGPLEVLVSDTIERRQARVMETGELARETVGDDDAFVKRLQEDPVLADMLVEASETASRTALSAKRRAMGRVVGNAVRDDALIEEGQLLLAALRDLEAPHFLLLARIEAGEQQNLAAVPLPEPVRSGLVRHGAVETVGTYGGGQAVTGLTSFGRRLLDLVRAEDLDRVLHG